MKNLILSISLVLLSGIAQANSLEDCLQMASVMQPADAAALYEQLEAEGLLPKAEHNCDE